MPASDATGGARDAIEQVLRAERDAEVSLVDARAQAQAELAQARDDALAIVNRAAQRIARWQHTHARLLDERMGALRADAETSAQARPATDGRMLASAVAQVAARLTGGRHEGKGTG